MNQNAYSLYYLCDLHASQPARGDRYYDQLVRSYQITFCAYTVFPHYGDYVNAFSLRHNEHNDQLSDAIEIIFVELSKLEGILNKPVEEMSDMEKWSLFFRYAGEPSKREAINRVIESKEVLLMAGMEGFIKLRKPIKRLVQVIVMAALLIPMFMMKYSNIYNTNNKFGMAYIRLNTGGVIHLNEVETIEPAFWKGSRDGVLYYNDGRSKEVDVSNYGDFFGIKGEDRGFLSNGVLYEYNISDIE